MFWSGGCARYLSIHCVFPTANADRTPIVVNVLPWKCSCEIYSSHLKKRPNFKKGGIFFRCSNELIQTSGVQTLDHWRQYTEYVEVWQTTSIQNIQTIPLKTATVWWERCWNNLDAGSCLFAPGGGTCPQRSPPPDRWGGAARRGLGAPRRGSLSGVQCQTAETWPMATSLPENWHMKRHVKETHQKDSLQRAPTFFCTTDRFYVGQYFAEGD